MKHIIIGETSKKTILPTFLTFNYNFLQLLLCLLLFFFSGCASGMQKFPGQGSNLCHSSDNDRSLIHCAVKEFLTCWSFSVFCCLGPHLWCMKVPRLRVKSELQLRTYATATAMLDPSCRICDLHCSSWQCQMLNPLS